MTVIVIKKLVLVIGIIELYFFVFVIYFQQKLTDLIYWAIEKKLSLKFQYDYRLQSEEDKAGRKPASSTQSVDVFTS